MPQDATVVMEHASFTTNGPHPARPCELRSRCKLLRVTKTQNRVLAIPARLHGVYGLYTGWKAMHWWKDPTSGPTLDITQKGDEREAAPLNTVRTAVAFWGSGSGRYLLTDKFVDSPSWYPRQLWAAALRAELNWTDLYLGVRMSIVQA